MINTEKQYDMLIELDRLEKLMSSISEPLKILSLGIRNMVWGKSDENKLATILNICNSFSKIYINIYGENILVVDAYIDILRAKSDRYSEFLLDEIYQEIKDRIIAFKTQNIIKEHWEQINPYFINEYPKEKLFQKDIIAILNELFEKTIDVYPTYFYILIGDINYLNRGRRGKWDSVDDLLPPSIEVAIKNNIINRWNPPNKRYLYLAIANSYKKHSTSLSINEYSCLKEMRTKPLEIVTLSRFYINEDSYNKRAINLAYDHISRAEILLNFENDQKKIVSDIVDGMLINNTNIDEHSIINLIKNKKEKLTAMASILIGQSLLKEICEAIFVPLDDTEDHDSLLKDKCYKSFHIIAEYLESRGISGIVYPSTRMKIEKLQGKNLVLFNVSDANPNIASYKTITSE